MPCASHVLHLVFAGKGQGSWTFHDGSRYYHIHLRYQPPLSTFFFPGLPLSLSLPSPPPAAFSPILYGDTLNGFRKTDSKRFNSNPHGMPQHQRSYPFSVFESFAP